MKITVFCEATHSKEVDKVYPKGLGRTIADIFGKNTRLVIHDNDDGARLLDVLGDTEVLVWWSHGLWEKVSDEVANAVAERVRRGMGFIVLHSAHISKPFRYLLGTTCSLRWREAGENERLWVVDPTHPIADGVGDYVDIPAEETYGEFFDIPTPDELVFLAWFKGGEVFRGGCVFKRGCGKIFYFNPGHETFPTYKIAKIKRIMRNAAKYVCPKEISEPYTFSCPKAVPAPEDK